MTEDEELETGTTNRTRCTASTRRRSFLSAPAWRTAARRTAGAGRVPSVSQSSSIRSQQQTGQCVKSDWTSVHPARRASVRPVPSVHCVRRTNRRAHLATGRTDSLKDGPDGSERVGRNRTESRSQEFRAPLMFVSNPPPRPVDIRTNGRHRTNFFPHRIQASTTFLHGSPVHLYVLYLCMYALSHVSSFV